MQNDASCSHFRKSLRRETSSALFGLSLSLSVSVPAARHTCDGNLKFYILTADSELQSPRFYFVFFREYTVFGGGAMFGAQSLMFFVLSEKAFGDSLEFQRHLQMAVELVEEKRFGWIMTS